MGKPLPLQRFAWLILAALLSLTIGISRAQSQNYQLDYTREGAWRYVNQPETLYQINARIVQGQLTKLGKQLNHLSAVDPPVYVTVQEELTDYLYQLETSPADYGNQTVYQLITLRLIQFDDQVKVALVEARRHRFDAGAEPAADSMAVEGRKALLLPYALLFRRADYRSKLNYAVRRGEQVTILERHANYYLVVCGDHTGYLPKGMVLQILP